MKQPNNGKITALYERLSKDDEQKSDNVSIAHQKQILEDYAQKNGFPKKQYAPESRTTRPREAYRQNDISG